MTHICVGNLTIIGSDKGLSPRRRQTIIWTNAGKLLIEPLGTILSEISIAIQTFSSKKMYYEMSSAKWCPFCLGLNVLTHFMMKTWHENIFYITGLLGVKSTTDPQGVTSNVERRVLVFFFVVVVSMNKLLNKQASCQCFDMQWCSSMWYPWNVLKENWLWKLDAFCKTCRKPSISLDNTETGRHWNRTVVSLMNFSF